jgi:hypothetical protein
MNQKFKVLKISLIISLTVFYPLINAAYLVAAEAPSAPSAPGTPGASTAPSSPQVPSAPELPQAPQQPEKPGIETPTVQQPSAPVVPQSHEGQLNSNSTDSGSDSVASQSGVGDTGGGTGTGDTSQKTTTSSSADNSKTGAGSENLSEVKNDDKTVVKTDNQASIGNDLVLSSVSGGNSADKNTGDGKVVSGNASIQGAVVNQANSTTQNIAGGVCGGCGEGSGSSAATNNTTGADSSNNANVETNSETMLTNNNSANLDTGIIALADSGGNSASKNTGNGEVMTGDANIGLTVVNVANTDIAGVQTSQFDVYDDHNGDIVISPAGQNSISGNSSGNSKTGVGSNNQALVDSNTSLTIVNNNDAKVASDLVLDAGTGHNTASKNTGDGSVTTGDVNVVANVINLVNTTADVIVATINIFGNLVGDIILSPLAGCGNCDGGTDNSAGNSQTGTDSVNTASVGVTRVAKVQQNNEANINNSMVINANTGGNSADKNTGDSSISTGEINVHAQEMTVANQNVIGNGDDTWWVVIVNEAGKWVGKVLGADINGNVVVVDTIPLDQSVGDGGLSADNNKTGVDSVNTASMEQNNNTEIVQNNMAEVSNNIVINADTGHNQADKNTGNGMIKTGDVNVYSNVINYVNNNLLGGKVVVAFINVFGSWVGNLVTPGYESRGESLGDSNIESASSETLAIGGSESVPVLTPATDSQSLSGNDQKDDDESGNENQTASDGGNGQTVDNTDVEAIDAWLEGRVYNAKVKTMSDRERVKAGIWLTEDDGYLVTTPTPGVVMGSWDGLHKSSDNTNRAWWLLLSTPLGWAAWWLKRRFDLVSLTAR